MKSMISIFLTLILVYFLFPTTSYSTETGCLAGSRSAGMCRSSVSITDFWSIYNNQAGLAGIEKSMIGVYYESRFLMTNLGSRFISGVVPLNVGVIGLSYYNMGYELFSRQKIGLAFARSFGSNTRVGVQLDYIITSIGGDYGNINNVTFELGVQSDVTETLTLGAWVFNPLLIHISDHNNEKIPAIIRFGFTWKISDNLMTLVESGINSNESPVVIRGGAEYNIKDNYFFRTGFSTGEEIFSFGAGIVIKKLTFDISSIMHKTLGFSPQSSLIFIIK